jgi:hypothetical protein
MASEPSISKPLPIVMLASNLLQGESMPPSSTSAQSTPITSWSVIDVDPVARARWVNEMMIFGHPDYSLNELCGDLLPL